MAVFLDDPKYKAREKALFDYLDSLDRGKAAYIYSVIPLGDEDAARSHGECAMAGSVEELLTAIIFALHDIALETDRPASALISHIGAALEVLEGRGAPVCSLAQPEELARPIAELCEQIVGQAYAAGISREAVHTGLNVAWGLARAKRSRGERGV